VPVEAYLRPQKRFAHLFGENADVATLERLQAMADRNIRRYGLTGRDAEGEPERRAVPEVGSMPSGDRRRRNADEGHQ
jgi:pyruvate ferredoxin oxidoreductase beta subunit